jgi:hypothetical protein
MKSLKKYIQITLIAFILLSLTILYPGCGQKEPAGEVVGGEVAGGEAEKIIRMYTEGDAIHYQESILWDKKDFAEILESRSTFTNNKIEEFKETYDVDADNFNVEFTEDGNSTTLSCDVKGKYNGDWYDFLWFLNPLGLDFLDSPFKKSESGLSWEGVIDGVETTIILDFPFTISNCHGHVWHK